MFDNDTVKSVVECLWQHHVRSKWLLHFCQFTLFFLSYFVWSYLVVELVKEEKWFRLGDLWRKGHIINSAPPQTLVLLCLDAYFEIEVLIFLSRELYQFGRNGPIVCLMDMSNIMDLTCMVLLAVMPVLHVHAMGVTAGPTWTTTSRRPKCADKGDQAALRRLRELFVRINAEPAHRDKAHELHARRPEHRLHREHAPADLQGHRQLHDPARHFHNRLLDAFFLLFAQNLTRDVWIPPRTTVAATARRRRRRRRAGRGHDAMDYENSLLNSYIMMLGDWDLDAILALPNWRLGLSLFCLWLFIACIMLLNVLIALLSDSYASVVEIQNAASLKERASIILEFMQESSEAQMDAIVSANKWVHILCPVDIKAREEEERNDDGFDEDDKNELIAEADKDKEELLLKIDGCFQNFCEKMEISQHQLDKVDKVLDSVKRNNARELKKTISTMFFGKSEGGDEPGGGGGDGGDGGGGGGGARAAAAAAAWRRADGIRSRPSSARRRARRATRPRSSSHPTSTRAASSPDSPRSASPRRTAPSRPRAAKRRGPRDDGAAAGELLAAHAAGERTTAASLSSSPTRSTSALAARSASCARRASGSTSWRRFARAPPQADDALARRRAARAARRSPGCASTSRRSRAVAESRAASRRASTRSTRGSRSSPARSRRDRRGRRAARRHSGPRSSRTTSSSSSSRACTPRARATSARARRGRRRDERGRGRRARRGRRRRAAAARATLAAAVAAPTPRATRRGADARRPRRPARARRRRRAAAPERPPPLDERSAPGTAAALSRARSRWRRVRARAAPRRRARGARRRAAQARARRRGGARARRGDRRRPRRNTLRHRPARDVDLQG